MDECWREREPDVSVNSYVVLDIEIYPEWGPKVWAQAHYLVHGWSDVLWTNDREEAIQFLRASLGEV